MKPFKNTQFPDEHYEQMIDHLKAMEAYMIKVNTGQETPDNGRREIFNIHFDEVKRLRPNLFLPPIAKIVMAQIYRTHPAFADAPPPTPEPPPPPIPRIATEEFDLSKFKSVDELYEYGSALGALALSHGQQTEYLSEEDRKDVLKIIDIMETEPERLPPDFDLIEVKSFYDGFFKILILDEYVHRVTVQIAFGFESRWNKKRPN